MIQDIVESNSDRSVLNQNTCHRLYRGHSEKALLFLCALCALVGGSSSSYADTPKVLDPDLQLDLFLSEPEIVTPVALDVDQRGRVWVIESHTHFPLAGYSGNGSDRVIICGDSDRDGHGDRRVVFADGFTHLMGLRLRSERSVYLATRRELYQVDDQNGDDRADSWKVLLRLDTKGDYPHNGLSGLTIGALGRVYVGLGENLGAAYRLMGKDNVVLGESGEGGSIFRVRPDGSRLERWATGFWNPFHLGFDGFGNLFALDNDADSRPPCRLLHVIRGGNYGYRFWLGRKGLHPYTSWDGELPGTLAMAAGTGEAPSGLAAYEHHRFPEKYHGGLFVTSWGDNRLEFYRPTRNGSSFTARREIVVQGGEAFRPVGIAVGPDGDLFFSDWVDQSYNVHGKGRIWRLRRRLGRNGDRDTGVKVKRRPLALNEIDELISLLGDSVGTRREKATQMLVERRDSVRHVLRAVRVSDNDRLGYHALAVLARRGALRWPLVSRLLETDRSPGLQAAALRFFGETRSIRAAALRATLKKGSPGAQLEALLHLQDARGLDAEVLDNVLSRDDPFLRGALLSTTVRLAKTPSVMGRVTAWRTATSADRRHLSLLVLRQSKDRRFVADFLRDENLDIQRSAVQWVGEQKLTEHRPAIERFLKGSSPTADLLDAALAAVALLDGGNPNERDREQRGEHLLRIATDRSQEHIEIRRAALRSVQPNDPKLTVPLLESFLAEADERLRVEAIRTLRETEKPRVPGLLRKVASDDKAPLALRLEAVAGLGGADDRSRDQLVTLLDAAEPRLRREAARSLIGSDLDALVATRRDRLVGTTLASKTNARGAIESAAVEANAAEGEYLFFHPRRPGCARCHTIHGRGGSVGTDLSTIGQRPLEKIVEAVLYPSKDVAPQYTTWAVVTRADSYVGIILGTTESGGIQLGTTSGEIVELAADSIVSRASQTTSIMPENLLAELTVEDAAALIAFLTTLK